MVLADISSKSAPSPTVNPPAEQNNVEIKEKKLKVHLQDLHLSCQLHIIYIYIYNNLIPQDYKSSMPRLTYLDGDKKA